MSLWTTRELAFGIGAGFDVCYIGTQFIDEDNIFQIDEALVFNANVYYKLNNLKFSLNLRNFTNEEYEMRGFGAYSVIPAAPRAIFGKVDFSL